MKKTTYDIIKHQNGEKFARALRDNNLLNIPNIAKMVKFVGHDPDLDLLGCIRAQKFFKMTDEHSDQDPFELLHRAGYEFVEYADTLEKQNSIKKYFREDEELCTFRDRTRYQNYYIINAVKYGADKIHPSPTPQRQDEYGTSVISIQIHKTNGYISIKNRYNNSVEDCDDTFDSNPDNIIAGLSAALKTRFKINWDEEEFELPCGYTLFKGNILKFNHLVHYVDCADDSFIEDSFVGENFYTKHDKIYELDKDSQTMLEYFIWDAKHKKLLNPTGLNDGFIQAFNEETAGKKVTLTGRAPNQTLYINGKEAIKLQGGRIVWLNFPNIETTAPHFLRHSWALKQLHMENLKTTGNFFLPNNKDLRNLDLPKLQYAGNNFLCTNTGIKSVNLPNLMHAGSYFLMYNNRLREISLPNLLYADKCFLENNKTIEHVNFPRLQRTSSEFMTHNTDLISVNFPSLVEVGDMFLSSDMFLAHFSAPKLQTVGNSFLALTWGMSLLELPNLTTAGDRFLSTNDSLIEFKAPKLQTVGNRFLEYNNSLQYLELPELTAAGDRFLSKNKKLINFKAPKLQTVGNCFLAYNNSLQYLELPELTEAGDRFLFQQAPLDKLYLPKLRHVGTQFLQNNLFLEYLYAPMLTYIDKESLMYREGIRNQILTQRPIPFKRPAKKFQWLAHWRQTKHFKTSQEKSR